MQRAIITSLETHITRAAWLYNRDNRLAQLGNLWHLPFPPLLFTLSHRTRCFLIFFKPGISLVLMIPFGAGGSGGGVGAVMGWIERESSYMMPNHSFQAIVT